MRKGENVYNNRQLCVNSLKIVNGENVFTLNLNQVLDLKGKVGVVGLYSMYFVGLIIYFSTFLKIITIMVHR